MMMMMMMIMMIMIKMMINYELIMMEIMKPGNFGRGFSGFFLFLLSKEILLEFVTLFTTLCTRKIFNLSPC